MSSRTLFRHIAFALRCAGSASLTHVLARKVGLAHPIWAVMSALIVSQERLADTRRSLFGRIVGTLVGAAIAVAVDALCTPFGAPITAKVALAVLVAAPPTRKRPPLRVSMWTGPLVLLTPMAGRSVPEVALLRSSEVILGCAVGAVLHAAVAATLERLCRLPEEGPRGR